MIEYINETPLKKPLIFDTHAHYDDSRFDEDREILFDALNQNGVGGIITCGCDLASSKKAIKMAEEHEFVYAAVGMHPGNMEKPDDLNEIENKIAINKINTTTTATQIEINTSTLIPLPPLSFFCMI